MIKHIVLWRLDASYSEEEKSDIMHEFRNRLAQLDKKITELLHLEVYFRDKTTSETNYDIILDSVFNSVEDLNTYQNHPEHLKVVAYGKTLKLQRAAIDFSF